MSDISRTKFAVEYIYFDVFVALFRLNRIIIRRFFKRFAERASDFSRYAEYALTVGTVCKYRDIEDVIKSLTSSPSGNSS